jgi:hypothetical protein
MKVFLIVGSLMLIIGNIGGIGYGLYLWGSVGLPFATAAWMAFKFWVLWQLTGISSIMIAKLLS